MLMQYYKIFIRISIAGISHTTHETLKYNNSRMHSQHNLDVRPGALQNDTNYTNRGKLTSHNRKS